MKTTVKLLALFVFLMHLSIDGYAQKKHKNISNDTLQKKGLIDQNNLDKTLDKSKLLRYGGIHIANPPTVYKVRPMITIAELKKDKTLFESNLYIFSLKNRINKLRNQLGSKFKKTVMSNMKLSHDSSNDGLNDIKETQQRIQKEIKVNADVLKQEKKDCKNWELNCELDLDLIARVDLDLPKDDRDCPRGSENKCFPVPLLGNFKYFIVPNSVKFFKAEFFNLKGEKLGETMNASAIRGIKNYKVYNLNTKNLSDKIVVKVIRSTDSENINYETTIIIER